MANFFYIKSGFGTRTVGGGFATKQTGSFTALGAANVYASISAALADTTPPVAGDVLVCSDAHAYSVAAAITYILGGLLIVSVSDTACDTYSRGASESTTGANSITFKSTTGNGYRSVGVNYNCGTAGNPNFTFTAITGTERNEQGIFEDCSLIIGAIGTVSKFALTSISTSAPGRVIWRNVDISFGASSQFISIGVARFYWHGGSILASSVAPNYLMTGNTGRLNQAEIIGVDLSHLSSSGALMYTSGGQGGLDINCADLVLPAAWTGSPVSGTLSYSDKVDMNNWGVGNTNYRFWHVRYNGQLIEDTVHYLTGGASDGVTPVSMAMTSNAGLVNADDGLASEEILQWVDTTGTKTIAVEILTDGQLTDKDVALDVIFMDSSTLPLAKWQTTELTPIDSATNLPAGAGTGSWASTSGLTTPTSSKLQLTGLVVNQKGFVAARIRLLKASTTVYVNPVLSIT